MTKAITLSVGRDYTPGYSSRYEFCVFCGDKLIVRKGGFKSAAAAKRHGIKVAAA
jgi:hypothetical protein